MAKKTVAGYRDKSQAKAFSKVIVAIKNPKTGAYTYKEEIVPSGSVEDFVKDASSK